jgi:hypothetical protein
LVPSCNRYRTSRRIEGSKGFIKQDREIRDRDVSLDSIRYLTLQDKLEHIPRLRVPHS